MQKFCSLLCYFKQLTTPTGKPVGFLLPSLAYNKNYRLLFFLFTINLCTCKCIYLLVFSITIITHPTSQIIMIIKKIECSKISWIKCNMNSCTYLLIWTNITPSLLYFKIFAILAQIYLLFFFCYVLFFFCFNLF